MLKIILRNINTLNIDTPNQYKLYNCLNDFFYLWDDHMIIFGVMVVLWN